MSKETEQTEQTEQKIEKVREIFPEASFEHDLDGQLVIYTETYKKE